MGERKMVRVELREKLIAEFGGKYIRTHTPQERTRLKNIIRNMGGNIIPLHGKDSYSNIYYVKAGTSNIWLASINWEINSKKIIEFSSVELFIKEHKSTNKLPNEIIFNGKNGRTTLIFNNYKGSEKKKTLIYDNNRIVRAELAKGEEYELSLGLHVGLLKGLNIVNYRGIINYAYKIGDKVNDHSITYFYIMGALQQHIGISPNQLEKLWDHAYNYKPEVNINGHIIKFTYKGGE